MTNAEIIDRTKTELMQQGILKGSGKFITTKNAEGVEIKIELPQEIHTFSAWKELGYSVKKGEKSKIKFPIWKCAVKKGKNDKGEDEEKSSMFMKVSAFFTAEQVEKIKQ